MDSAITPRPPVAALRVFFSVAALAVLAAGFWLRASHLNHPMRNDESFSYIVYVTQGDYFDYSRPNNHILNTLLMAAASHLAGNSPVSLRFPAFFFGVLLMPAVGLLCYQLCRSIPGAIAATALAASSTALVEYSVNARGYSLIGFAGVMMACLTVKLRDSPGWKTGWALWIFCGVAGLYTVPVMVYSIAPLVVLFLMDRWILIKPRLRPLAVSLAAIGIITAGLYTPVIAQSGLASITANPFVTPEPPGALLKDIAQSLSDLATMWGGNASVVFLPVLCAGTLLCGLPGAWRGRNQSILLALTAIAVTFCLSLLQRRMAPTRVYLFLQPWMIACSCAAIVRLCVSVPGRYLRIVAAALLLLPAVENFFIVQRQPLLISEDPHTYVEAREVAVDLIHWGADQPDISIIWNPRENLWPPFLYYFLQLHPRGGYPISWRDDHSKAVFLLIGKADNIADITRRDPAFTRLYGEPKLMKETANSRIYLARRI